MTADIRFLRNISTQVYNYTRIIILYRSSFARMKFLTITIAFFTLPGLAQRAEIIAGYIAQYQQFAIEEQIRTGVPASITMAQGIHESGAGLGELAIKSNNHFGIKCKNTWTGDKVYHDDDEKGECFRSYHSVEASFRDHSDFIRSGARYSFLFTLNPMDYAGWANGLKQAGYATNPKYPQVLIRLIEENNLAALTETAMLQDENKPIGLTAASSSSPNDNKEALHPAASGKQVETVERKTPGNITEKSASAPLPIFKVNHCRGVLAVAGSSLFSIAKQHGIKLANLLEYNDMGPNDKLAANQIIYLEPKRKKGNNKVHEVKKGESPWQISQLEGIRLDKLLEFNRLSKNAKLKTGQLVYLKGSAPKGAKMAK